MNIKELSKEEVLKLTDDQIKIYIDWECAVEGVKMFSRPDAPKKTYEVEKKDVAYVLPQVIIKDYSIVEQITKILAQAPTFQEEYDYSGMGYDYKWLKASDNDIASKKAFYYKHDDLSDMKTLIAEYKRAYDRYEKALKEFQKHDSARADIANDIYRFVNEIKEQDAKKDELLKRFEEYKTIAKGDASTAAKFLVKAYPEATELLAGLIVLPEPEQKEEKTGEEQ